MKYNIGDILETENLGNVRVIGIYTPYTFFDPSLRLEQPVYCLLDESGIDYLILESNIMIRGL